MMFTFLWAHMDRDTGYTQVAELARLNTMYTEAMFQFSSRWSKENRDFEDRTTSLKRMVKEPEDTLLCFLE